VEFVLEPPPALDDPGGFFQAGPVRIWYSDLGDGEPLTLLGGFTAGHHIWDFVRPHLADYRTLTWEPRGLGRSDCPDPTTHPYGAEVWAEDLKNLLAGLGVQRTHLWAAGFGNYYAIRFAAQYPEMIGAFVAFSDVWSGAVPAYGKIWEVYRTIVEQFGTKGFGARMLTGIFAVPWLPWFAEWEAKNIEEVLHPETVAATVGYGLTQADVRDELSRIRAPVMVLQGGQGWEGEPLDLEADESLTLMREGIDGLEVVIIPDSHPGYVLAHKPEECAGAANIFLSRYPLS
jgi:pimeloyl-ACP methyl ester carboxylesterase